MISALISRLIILFMGTLYPAFASYKAIRTKDMKEYVKWMMYWIVFALFIAAETFTDVFLSFWFPFYYEIKIVLVLWLLSPITKGTSIMYRKVIHPLFLKKEKEIDEFIARTRDQSYCTVLDLGRRGVSVATNAFMNTALKGSGGLLLNLKKSYSLADLSMTDLNLPFQTFSEPCSPLDQSVSLLNLTQRNKSKECNAQILEDVEDFSSVAVEHSDISEVDSELTDDFAPDHAEFNKILKKEEKKMVTKSRIARPKIKNKQNSLEETYAKLQIKRYITKMNSMPESNNAINARYLLRSSSSPEIIYNGLTRLRNVRSNEGNLSYDERRLKIKRTCEEGRKRPAPPPPDIPNIFLNGDKLSSALSVVRPPSKPSRKNKKGKKMVDNRPLLNVVAKNNDFSDSSDDLSSLQSELAAYSVTCSSDESIMSFVS